MIEFVKLSTFENKYFKLDLHRGKRDVLGTYTLIRYELPDDPIVWNAVANNWVTVYMSEYEHMSSDIYMGGLKIEDIAVNKTVTDVSSILRFYDIVIDNTDINPDKVYAYTFVVEESGSKYRTPYVTAYIENEIGSFSRSFRPSVVTDWMKHRGVADLTILNLQLENAYYDIRYYEGVYNSVLSLHDDVMKQINVNELMNKAEQVLGVYNLLQKNLPPSRTITDTLDWGVAEFGTGIWGLAKIIIELGWPYSF